MAELNTIVSDGYDREVAADLLLREAALRRWLEKAGRLLPHAEALYQDLFASLFKLNVVLRPAKEVSVGVFVNRRLMEAVTTSRALEQLRERTLLDEDTTARALMILAEQVLASLTREDRIRAEELLEIHDIAFDEDALAAREGELEHLGELQEGALPEEEAVRAALKGEIARLRERIEKARKVQERAADRLSREMETEIGRSIASLPQKMEEVDDQLAAFGLGGAGEGRVGAERRFELGERLLASKKLQLLARLLGAFKEVAFEARRRRVVRAPQEVHAVKMGGSLEHLLPSELLGVTTSRRALHLDFLRRLLEGEVLEYALEAAAERGPMVVCVDGSGSMQGSKELWAKAVALTLMEIARREKRRCLALIFSSGGAPFEVELLETRRGGGARASGRKIVREQEVLRFAEHFPGGGTSFEEPLRRAVEVVSEGRYRRGDIVFITDGEASVSAELLEELERAKKRHAFRVRGILVDVTKGSRADVLDRFADDVRRITDLTADSMADLFAEV